MNLRLRKTLPGVILVLLVVGLFLARRTGTRGPGAPPFDPADYRDVPVLTPQAASQQIGERAGVCGTVAATRYAREVQGRPTYLNLGRPYPDQLFDVVIWGRDRGSFSRAPELRYRRRGICIWGRVSEHRGVPRIEVRVPEQIRVRGPTPDGN